MKAIVCVLLLIGMLSCQPVLYSNVGYNVPMFSKKGELNMHLGYASSSNLGAFDEGDGLSFNLAHSFHEKWAGIFSYYYLNNPKDSRQDNWRVSGNYWELGGGRFGTNSSKKISYEVFVGMGGAHIQNAYEFVDRVDLRYIKPFVQPSLGFTTQYFDLIFTPRFAYIDYTENSIKIRDQDIQASIMNFFEERDNTLVFEPGFTIRGGVRGVKAQIQFGFSSFQDLNEEETLNNNFYVSIGGNFLISNRYKQ